MAGQFVPGSGGRDCGDYASWGQKSTRFDYIYKGQADEDDYPEEACEPWLHGNAQIDNLQVNTELNGDGDVNVDGDVKSNGGSHILSNKKNLPFDMPHPNKPGWRLRHVCIEGPEIAVYCRGKIPTNGIINLPSFWDGLVNPEDMSISLTPFGTWQELFVKEIKWGKQVIVRNNASGPINGDYYIVARRLDDDLIVEYEGESHDDYPGGNEGYTFSWEDGYVKGLIKKFVEENLDT
tara:strand:- start:1219 stop:1926 length:708 start_codon:yes stop_codon:yes gene_type:complete